MAGEVDVTCKVMSSALDNHQLQQQRRQLRRPLHQHDDDDHPTSFPSWVRRQTQPCWKNHGESLIQMGATWDTFRARYDNDGEGGWLVECTHGTIPKLAATDMARLVQDELRRNEAPMAVFWDIENMPLPSARRVGAIGGREVVQRIQTALAPYGTLKVFRAYTSLGEGKLPERIRSDLQLGGCDLVDCPHVGRKDVADKRIIVDAMEYAYTHMDCATICLISSDVDFAYLMTKLQKPQWRTVLISKTECPLARQASSDIQIDWVQSILERNEINDKQSASKSASAPIMDHRRKLACNNTRAATLSGRFRLNSQDSRCGGATIRTISDPNIGSQSKISTNYLPFDTSQVGRCQGFSREELVCLEQAAKVVTNQYGSSGIILEQDFLKTLRRIDPSRFGGSPGLNFLRTCREAELVQYTAEGDNTPQTLLLTKKLYSTLSTLSVPASASTTSLQPAGATASKSVPASASTTSLQPAGATASNGNNKSDGTMLDQSNKENSFDSDVPMHSKASHPPKQPDGSDTTLISNERRESRWHPKTSLKSGMDTDLLNHNLLSAGHAGHNQLVASPAFNKESAVLANSAVAASQTIGNRTDGIKIKDCNDEKSFDAFVSKLPDGDQSPPSKLHQSGSFENPITLIDDDDVKNSEPDMSIFTTTASAPAGIVATTISSPRYIVVSGSKFLTEDLQSLGKAVQEAANNNKKGRTTMGAVLMRLQGLKSGRFKADDGSKFLDRCVRYGLATITNNKTKKFKLTPNYYKARCLEGRRWGWDC